MTDERGYDDGQLPWLAAVEDEHEPRGVSARKMLAALLLVLLAVALVAATFFWIGRRDARLGGAPELIKAEPAPYKVKPPNPGGLDVAGDSQTAFETSAGEDLDAKLDPSKIKEIAPTPPPAADDKPKPAPETKVPEIAAAEPPKATGGTGSVVQLGAFANKAQAERAWSVLSGRFPAVAGMTKMVVPFPGGIRLRAAAGSPADAKAACQALKAAGENCFVAQ